MQRKRKAFTLIELLVVITTIAVFAAILLPILQTVRESAKAVICGSNVKQLGVALTAYEMQNGTFPYACDSNSQTKKTTPPGGWAPSQYDKQGWWWFNFLYDFLGKRLDKKSVLWCPSRQIKDISIKPNILLGNYGVNQSICKSREGKKDPLSIGIPLRSSQIPHSAQTFLLADCGYGTITWEYAQEPSSITGSTFENSAYIPGLWPKGRGAHRAGTDLDALNGRHPKKGVNVGFVDGHIARLKAANFLVEKNGADYTNRSPLWLP